MFWLLIKTDNITFKLQLSEKLEDYNIAHEAHRTYTDFRDEKVCLNETRLQLRFLHYVRFWEVYARSRQMTGSLISTFILKKKYSNL